MDQRQDVERCKRFVSSTCSHACHMCAYGLARITTYLTIFRLHFMYVSHFRTSLPNMTGEKSTPRRCLQQRNAWTYEAICARNICVDRQEAKLCVQIIFINLHETFFERRGVTWCGCVVSIFGLREFDSCERDKILFSTSKSRSFCHTHARIYIKAREAWCFHWL